MKESLTFERKDWRSSCWTDDICIFSRGVAALVGSKSVAMLADPVLSKSKEGELDTMEVESNAQLDQTRSCLDLAVANRWKYRPTPE